METLKEAASLTSQLSKPENKKFRFLRKNLYPVFFWPIIAGLVLWLLWGMTFNALDNARTATRDEAFRETKAITSAYATQLQHTLEQIDHITLGLKYQWEHTDIVLDLEDQKRKGLFPESAFLYAQIVDRDGNIVTSTLPSKERPNLVGVPYFQEQKSGRAKGLLIGGPRIGLRSKRPAIWFTRRLEYPDGTFGGVAVVAVEPPFLTSFRDESVLGDKDIMAVRYLNGPILAMKSGSESSEGAYRAAPVFSGKSGVKEEAAEMFEDRQARIVAWEKLDKYSLVAIAMRSRQDAFSPFETMARRYRNMASVASVFLVLLALTGMVFTARLAWRRQQAEEVKMTYRAATEAANEGFYILRPLFGDDGLARDFVCEDCNERGGALIGLGRQEIVGRKLSEVVPGTEGRELLAIFGRAMEIGFYEDEIRVSPPSAIKATWVYRRVVRTHAGLALTLRDISQEKAQEQALAALANTDALTKLPNRHWLTNYLPTAIDKAKSREATLAILFIDLDNFKTINDTLGHDAGDELLREAATRLKKAVRTSDHVVRLGGDEFMVILEQANAVEDVSRVAGHIVKSIGAPFTLAGTGDNRVNASIGISMFPKDGDDADTLVKHADVAMYAAKAAGKGRYRFYESYLSDSLLLKLNKEQALRQAIERDEFVLYYQPRVGAHSGQMFGMEALLRWAHPEKGLIPPNEFIDIAEDSGLILPLGELVFDKVCAQLAQWQAQNLEIRPVSINVSARQLREGKIDAALTHCTERHGIAPALIEIELTESSMIEKNKALTDELAALRSLGVKIVIDNFGTGYSSLAQLQRLDVDILKVDCTFTHALQGDKEDDALFKSIVSMANALGICVAAEGVETAQQLQVLQSIACDEVQGYFVSHPVPAGDMALLLRKRFLFPPSVSASPVPVA